MSIKSNKEAKVMKKPLSKKKRRLIVIITAATLLVLAAGYTVFIAPLLEKEQWVYKETVVERGTLKVGVTESGSLEYGINSILYDLDLEIEQEEEEEDNDEEIIQKYLKIEEVYVAVGQRIAEGDILFKFTEDSVSDVKKLLQNALVDAKSEHAQAQADYNLALLEAKNDYQSQLLNKKYASAIYDKSEEDLNNEIPALQIEILLKKNNTASLQSQVEAATKEYNAALETYQSAQKPQVSDYDSEGFLAAQQEYLNVQTKYQNAKSNLESAQQSLSEHTNKIEELENKLAMAQSKLDISSLELEQQYQESLIAGDNALINYNAQVEELETDLEETENRKKKIEEQMEAFENFVGEDGCLYADGSGIVTEVNYEVGQRLESTGVMVAYAPPDDMTISVDVTQEDIVDLKVGDKVDITFMAYEDSTYEGSIRSIKTTATSENSNTVSYTVVIAVEGDTNGLYGGMTADVIFVTQQKENVLYVSKKAIVEENGNTYVYIKNSLGDMELTKVAVGLSNGVDVEILSGLNEGDKIYLASRVESEESVMSEQQQNDSESMEDMFGEGGFSMPEGMDGQMPDMEEFMNGNEMPGGGGFTPGGSFPGGGNMFGSSARP